MSLKDILVPLWKGMDEDKIHTLVVNEFAGRMKIEILSAEFTINLELYFDDLEKAWKAVNRY